MNDSPQQSPPTPAAPSTTPRNKKTSWPLTLLLTLVFPVTLAVLLLYQLDSFQPASYPIHELTHLQPLSVPARNPNLLGGAERIGEGQLLGPEDIAYDPKSGIIYTGCNDGWVKRVGVKNSVVEDWVNTGGRPLGLVVGQHGEIIVADADKGLLNITSEGEIQLLTEEAEGVKFKLTDGVDFDKNGVIYFTDASHKYSFWEFIWDFLEGAPHGRFLSYDPSTKRTTVLARDLYFANGVAVSPDQQFAIFCETPMMRCKKYYIEGEKKGSVEIFVENLPGMPDNIRYDGDGLYWIAFSTGKTFAWEHAQKYPFLRKIMGILEKYQRRPHVEKNAGAFSVDLEGKPVAYYYDPKLTLISGALRISDMLYCGSFHHPYLLRLNLTQFPAFPHPPAAV